MSTEVTIDPITGEPIEVPVKASSKGNPERPGGVGGLVPNPDPSPDPTKASSGDPQRPGGPGGPVPNPNPVVSGPPDAPTAPDTGPRTDGIGLVPEEVDPDAPIPSYPGDGVGPIGPFPDDPPVPDGFVPVGGIGSNVPMPTGGAPRAGAPRYSGPDGTRGRAGQIDPATGEQYTATTREVTENELVSHQLQKLLDSDSKYMQSARRAGLAQSNSRGGLGGSIGIGAAMNAAIKAGLPIATADAQAYRDAAAQNMNALNQFSLANMQRVTQIAMANLDADTRVQITSMNNANQMAVAKLNSMTQINIANLQSETQFSIQRMQNQFQERLADIQFQQTQYLNDQTHANRQEQIALTGEYSLANTGLQGDYGLASQDIANQQVQESNYVNAAMGAYSSYMNGLANLNGQEMDQAARDRAADTLYNAFVTSMNLVNLLYPDQIPIEVVPPGGGGG